MAFWFLLGLRLREFRCGRGVACSVPRRLPFPSHLLLRPCIWQNTFLLLHAAETKQAFSSCFRLFLTLCFSFWSLPTPNADRPGSILHTTTLRSFYLYHGQGRQNGRDNFSTTTAPSSSYRSLPYHLSFLYSTYSFLHYWFLPRTFPTAIPVLPPVTGLMVRARCHD